MKKLKLIFFYHNGKKEYDNLNVLIEWCSVNCYQTFTVQVDSVDVCTAFDRS